MSYNWLILTAIAVASGVHGHIATGTAAVYIAALVGCAIYSVWAIFEDEKQYNEVWVFTNTILWALTAVGVAWIGSPTIYIFTGLTAFIFAGARAFNIDMGKSNND